MCVEVSQESVRVRVCVCVCVCVCLVVKERVREKQTEKESKMTSKFFSIDLLSSNFFLEKLFWRKKEKVDN